MSGDIPAEPEILITRIGSLGKITLNRPKVLNSLSLTMVREIDAALDAFAADPAIRVVLMTGAGDRAFCAGGDIRALYDAGRTGEPLPEIFWREEYRLDARISAFAKPVVSVMNGITMGGGVGLAAHASHRVVIERTKFAMPEAGIGFFPDVGTSFLLTRKPGFFGTYIALSGVPQGPAETILSGMADHFIPESRIEALERQLGCLSPDASHETVTAVIATMAEAPTPSIPAEHLALIDRCFDRETMEEIFQELGRQGSPFAAETLALLGTKSPTSLKVTLALYRQGRVAPDLRACQEREFAVTAGMIAGLDFYEGVRAAIIDKDRNPRWQPDGLAAVDPSDVAAYFIPRHAPLFS